MRVRFFLSIFLVLVAATVAVSIVHFRFFRAERLRLIDQQIQGIASSLVSNLSVVEFEDIEEAEEVISETLGSDRITMIILIRSLDGGLYYRNRNAQIMGELPPLKPQWQNLDIQHHLVRMLNLPIADEGWVLQVGLLLDQGQVHWRTLSYSVVSYIAFIVALMLVGSWALTAVLLQPLRSLSAYLSHIAESSGAEMPLSLALASKPSRLRGISEDDEFGQLVTAASNLSLSIREQLRSTHAWTAQMAHELKTPLTIIRNSVESAQAQVSGRAQADLREAQDEIDHLGRIISGFLEWIRLENSPGQTREVHAIHLRDFARETAARLNRLNDGRVEVSGDADATVFANPDLLSQALTNLLQNALQYSPSTSNVHLAMDAQGFEVRDRGQGIPRAVLDKLGQPFNWGQEQHVAASGSALTVRGSGLGLAWVKTICDKYDWEFTIAQTGPEGTVIRVRFKDA